jgi:hypothetical protein
MKSVVSWDVARRRLIVCYRHFGAPLSDETGTLSRTKNAYPETWIASCQGTARNILLNRRSHLHSSESLKYRSVIRGSFQKFCTLYVFSLKMNLFYKVHLQAFNVISIVLYHSGPTFGQVLYSCQDAFVVDSSDYSGHLIRHLLSASEAFPTECFFKLWEQVKVWWAYVGTVQRVGNALAIHTFPKFPILHLRHEATRYRA